MFGGLWLREVVGGGLWRHWWWCGSGRGECSWFLGSTTNHFVSNCWFGFLVCCPIGDVEMDCVYCKEDWMGVGVKG